MTRSELWKWCYFIQCPRCKARVDEQCKTKEGKPTEPHKSRVQRASGGLNTSAEIL